MNIYRIATNADEDFKRRVQLCAESEGRSEAAMVRILLREALEQRARKVKR